MTQRPWLLAALLAFGLRAGAAVLTEHKEVLPAYYFNDARTLERLGWQALEDRRAGRGAAWPGPLSERVMIGSVSSVYSLTGRRPLVLKLLAAAAAAASVALFWLLVAPFFGASVATASALALAAWPSAVFYGSMFIKDPLVAPFVYGGLLLGLSVLAGKRPGALWTGALGVLVLLAHLRSYLLIAAGTAFTVAAFLAFRSSRRRAGALLALAVALPFAYRLIADRLTTRALKPQTAHYGSSAAERRADIIPSYETESSVRRTISFDPASITEYRRYRQRSDQFQSIKYSHRNIQTQIYPEAELGSWLDVALFIPRAGFTALFQPLPGLYPLEGKLGRWLSALENVVLLAGAALLLLRFRRLSLSPERAGLLAFFAVMALGASLLEFDLGSASRHKTLYLPLLFPFIFEALRPARRP